MGGYTKFNCFLDHCILSKTMLNFNFQDTIFQEYNMQGVSAEFNEIYLEVVIEHLVRALKSSQAAKSLKIKLAKKQTPCLSLEIELVTMSDEYLVKAIRINN